MNLQQKLNNATCFSGNGEDWSSDMDDLINDFENYTEAGEIVSFFIANKKTFTHADFICNALERVIEDAVEQAYDEVGEVAETYLNKVDTPENEAEFKQLVANFLQEKSGDVNIWQVINAQEVVAIWNGSDLDEYTIDKPDGIEDCDIQNLKHMLGATEEPSKWGYRNHFAAGGEDVHSMERLAKAGLVVKRNNAVTDNLYTATVAGCELLNFSQSMIDYAFDK